MENSDFTVQQSNQSGTIRCIETVTKCARPNSEYEAHSHHDDFEIYWFLDGDLFFSFEGQRIHIRKGDMVILCSNQLHRPIIREQCRYHRKRILFSKKLLAQLPENGRELHFLFLRRKIWKLSAEAVCAAGLDRTFDDIAQQLSRHTPYNDLCAMISLFYFLITAEQSCAGWENTETIPHGAKVYALMKYIDENLTADLSYQAIGEKFFISPKSLYQYFKRETGFTLSKYIIERRIIKAKSLLNAGASAAEAAASAGFQDYSVFYRRFVKATGLSPAQYVKLAQKTAGFIGTL